MKKHTKIYLEYFDYTVADFIPCEYCKKKAVDVHHLTFKKMGGSKKLDFIENLVALCRECHNNAHNQKDFNNKLKGIVKKRHD